MKPEDKKIFYISVVMVFFLGTISFWHFSRINLEEIDFSFPSYKETNLSNLDTLFSEEGLEDIARETGLVGEQAEEDIIYTRKVLDNKIRFDYPSSWITSEEEIIENEMHILFVTYADRAIYPSSLAVIKINAKSVNEVVEIFKKEIEKEGSVSNVSVEKKSETEHLLNMPVEYSQKLMGFYQGKIFLINNVYYLVVVMSFEQELSVSKNITDYILSSIQIIE